MDFRDRSALIRQADRAVAGAAYDPRKLVLIYAGVTAVVMFLVTAANFLLQAQIAGTGGLSGLAMRSMLETAIEVLQTAVNLILPFWTFGYLTCVLRMTRGQGFGPDTLLAGFRSFGPVLRLNILRGGYYLLTALLCLYPSIMIFLWTPFSAPFREILEPLAVQGTTGVILDDTTLAAATEALTPAFVIYGLLLLVVLGPKYYSFRMADYCLMDDPKAGARAAIRRSTVMLHKNRLALLQLDLRFWWFYLLDGLTLAVCYGDMLLALAGITLPISADVSYFLFYGMSLLVQLGLYVWVRSRIECAYCAGYECLKADLDEKLRQLMAEHNKNPQDA